MDTKSFRVPVTLDAVDKPTGSVSALFSVFNKRDDVGDVVLPSFFTDGQPIPMAAWGHAWESLPPGSGVIRVTDAGAVFDGQFFDTNAGQEHYKTVKALGDLQEWSFGFQVTEAYDGEFAGQPSRFLKTGTTFEASPVLVGANRETRTLSIKGATDPDAAEWAQVRTAAKVLGKSPAEIEALLAAGSSDDLAELLERTLRVATDADEYKVGRAISAERMGALGKQVEQLRALADALQAMLDEANPPAKSAAAWQEVLRFYDVLPQLGGRST